MTGLQSIRKSARVIVWPSMERRLVAAIGVLAAAFLGTGVASLVGQSRLSAQKPWTLPRLPWGDPDLQGIWPSTDMFGVPFERPAELASRTELSDKEFAEREAQFKRQSAIDLEQVPSTAARSVDKADPERLGTGPPAHWVEWGKPSRQASLVVEPGDGKVPLMTSEGQRRAAAVRSTFLVSEFYDFTWMDAYDRCISRGLLGSMFPVVYNNGNEIFQVPGYVVIRYEMIHETRVIPLDGRPHASRAIRSYMGDPRGHWDGTTLVVETTNFNGRTGAQPIPIADPAAHLLTTSDALKLVERFTRTGPETIQYEVTVNDPKTWVGPWKVAFPLRRDPSYGMFEYACHEGNHAMSNALSGSRATDK